MAHNDSSPVIIIEDAFDDESGKALLPSAPVTGATKDGPPLAEEGSTQSDSTSPNASPSKTTSPASGIPTSRIFVDAEDATEESSDSKSAETDEPNPTHSWPLHRERAIARSSSVPAMVSSDLGLNASDSEGSQKAASIPDIFGELFEDDEEEDEDVIIGDGIPAISREGVIGKGPHLAHVGGQPRGRILPPPPHPSKGKGKGLGLALPRGGFVRRFKRRQQQFFWNQQFAPLSTIHEVESKASSSLVSSQMNSQLDSQIIYDALLQSSGGGGKEGDDMAPYCEAFGGEFATVFNTADGGSVIIFPGEDRVGGSSSSGEENEAESDEAEAKTESKEESTAEQETAGKKRGRAAADLSISIPADEEVENGMVPQPVAVADALKKLKGIVETVSPLGAKVRQLVKRTSASGSSNGDELFASGGDVSDMDVDAAAVVAEAGAVDLSLAEKSMKEAVEDKARSSKRPGGARGKKLGKRDGKMLNKKKPETTENIQPSGAAVGQEKADAGAEEEKADTDRFSNMRHVYIFLAIFMACLLTAVAFERQRIDKQNKIDEQERYMQLEEVGLHAFPDFLDGSEPDERRVFHQNNPRSPDPSRGGGIDSEELEGRRSSGDSSSNTLAPRSGASAQRNRGRDTHVISAESTRTSPNNNFTQQKESCSGDDGVAAAVWSVIAGVVVSVAGVVACACGRHREWCGSCCCKKETGFDGVGNDDALADAERPNEVQKTEKHFRGTAKSDARDPAGTQHSTNNGVKKGSEKRGFSPRRETRHPDSGLEWWTSACIAAGVFAFVVFMPKICRATSGNNVQSDSH